MTGEDPCLSAPPHPALAPWLPILMQLVVNSSRSCFTVYFSGFKKKKIKNFNKKKFKKQNAEVGSSDIFFGNYAFF